MVKSASVLVPLPFALQPKQLLGQGFLTIGDIFVLSCLAFLMQVLTQSFTPQLLTYFFLSHRSLSCRK